MVEKEENKGDALMNIWAHAIQIKNKEMAEIALEELNKIEIGEIKDKSGSLLTIRARAMEINNEKIADISLKELLNEIELIEREDWINHQICGDFPKVDVRCLIWCCTSAKPCPYRNAVLSKMGKTSEDYAELKKALVQTNVFLNFVKERE